MLINEKTKHNVEDLIAGIECEKLKLYYCSFAEISEKDIIASTIIANSSRKMKLHLFDDAINDVIGVIKKCGDFVSTELIAIIMFRLLDLNEFYYYGKLCLLVDKYFQKGNSALVPILDRPFFAMAASISNKRTSDMIDAYTYALDHNYSELEQYVQNTGEHTFRRGVHADDFTVYQEVSKILSILNN